jgi:predicted Fe-Mo cluster-binding NifX family protein
MKIAVPVTENNLIDSHFGHCEFYNIYSISDTNEITEINTVDSLQGCGCKSDIASVLASGGVTVMLAGGIGGGAINVLNSNGIEVVRGCSGIATEVVKLYLQGLVEDSGSSCHQHDAHHQEGHRCNHN